MSPLIALTLTATLAAPAAPAPRAEAPLAAQAVSLAAEAPAISPSIATAPWAPPPGGDSLKNGAIAGAIVGALAFGGFVALLCHAMNDTGDDYAALKCGWRGALMGAAGGALVGAGADALFTRAPMARVRVRF